MTRRSRTPGYVAQRGGSSTQSTYVPGEAFDGYCVKFTNTSNEHLLVGSAAEYQFTQNDPFSIAIWFRMDTSDLSSDTGWMISNYYYTTPFKYWAIIMDQSSDQLYFRASDGTTTVQALADISVFHQDLRDDIWHLVVATFDGGGSSANAAIYIDGFLRGSGSGNLAGDISGDDLRIGNKPPTTVPWEGLMGPVGIWSAELTAAQAFELYNNGNNMDLRSGPAAASLVGYWRMGQDDTGTIVEDWSGYDNYATMVNMSVAADILPSVHYRAPYVYTPVSPGTKCIDFGGGGEKAENTSATPETLWMSTTKPFTVCFWTKATTGGGYYVALGDNFGSWIEGLWIRDMSSTQIQFELGNGAGTRYTRGIALMDTDEHRDGEWHFQLLRWDGTQYGFSYWWDGRRRIVSHSNLNNITDHTMSSIGQVHVGSGYTGKISGVAFWNRWITEAEIRQIYNNGTPINIPVDLSEDLIHYWPLGDDADDIYPILRDVVNGQYLTMTNMSSGDIVTDHPANPT